MAIDPRLFTPAAAKSQMLNELSGGMTPFDIRGRFGQRPTQNMFIPQQPLETTPQDDEQAAQIGTDIFGRSLEGISPEKIATMATDDPSKVDSDVQDLYEQGGEASKILGALTKMQEQESSTADLIQQLIGEETTPEAARAEINKFFDVKPDEKPAWADVALSVGLSLLRGESGTGDFLKDLGIAGQRGVAVSQEAKKERRARSDMFDKLAFGIWREDSKNRKNLIVQAQQFNLDNKQYQRSLLKDMTDYLTETTKMDQTASKNYASTMVDTINGLPKELKGEAARIIGANTKALSGLPLEELPSSIYALLEREGLDVSAAGLDTGKNIVTTEFNITDPETFAEYKGKFPDQFAGFETFNPDATYKVQGFVNKVEGDLTSILSVSSTPNKPDTQLGQLQLQRNDLRNQLLILEENDPNYKITKQMLDETNKAIEKAITTSTGQSFFFDEEGSLQAITSGDPGQGLSAQAALQKQVKLDLATTNFVRAAGIGDKILQVFARQPIGEEAGPIGVLASLGNTIGGFRGQLNLVKSDWAQINPDIVAKYTGRNDFSHLYDSDEMTDYGVKAGSVFKKFDQLTLDRQDIRSLVYDYAFALAGSREDGKLTDKDIANAMITLGGGDIAEGKWFANPDALIRGVSNALDLAANNLGPLHNQTMQKSIDLAIANGTTEADAEAQYRFDPKRIFRRLAADPTLHERVVYENGSLRYQPLDAYRSTYLQQQTAIPIEAFQKARPEVQNAALTLLDLQKNMGTQQGLDELDAFIDQLEAQDPTLLNEVLMLIPALQGTQ